MNSTLFKKNKRWLILFAAPAIILFCVIIVIPLFQTLYYSFFEWNGIKVAAFKGIENYKKLFHQGKLIRRSLTVLCMRYFWSYIRLAWNGVCIHSDPVKDKRKTDFSKCVFYSGAAFCIGCVAALDSDL